MNCQISLRFEAIIVIIRLITRLLDKPKGNIEPLVKHHHSKSAWVPSQYGPASGSFLLQRQIDELV